MLDDVGPEVVDSDAEQPAPPPAKPRVWTVFAAVTLATMVNIGLSVIVVVALMVNAVLQGASVQDAGDALLPKLMTPGMFMVLILFGGLAYGLGAIIPA